MADMYEPDKAHSKVIDTEAQVDSDNESGTYVIDALVREDHGHDIKLRTMTWQRAAWLLCGDQVCLAIMAQTWSLSYVSLPLSYTLAYVFKGTRMGSRNHHDAYRRHSLLHHIAHDAQVHHEASANHGHLRLRLRE
jgi:hypothetical protein